MSSATAIDTAKSLRKKGADRLRDAQPPEGAQRPQQGTREELYAVFEEARDDPAVRGVILTGAGDKAFVAGADISEMANDRRRGGGQSDVGKASTASKILASLWSRPQRLCAGRRLRASDGLHDPPGRRKGQVRPAGSQDRHHSGRWGNATPATAGRQRSSAAVDSHADMIGAQEAYRIGLVNEIVARTT